MTSRDRRAAAFVRLLLVLTLALAAWSRPALADLMIIGNDEKVVFDAEGKRSVAAPGKDTISVSILKVDGAKITDTGKKLKLPGQPASMRGRAQ
jgi:hypothetical protein